MGGGEPGLRQDAGLTLEVLLLDLTVLLVVGAAEVLDVAPIARWALARTFAGVEPLLVQMAEDVGQARALTAGS